jgi:hypothetical protein
MTEEEEAGEERPTSLYLSFPDFGEEDLACLTPWATGEEVCGGLYSDLFGSSADSPHTASLLSGDPFSQTVAELRAALAHVALLRYSGAFQCKGLPLETVYQSMYKFVELYPSFCATLIQRCWKATRPTAGPDDKQKYQDARTLNPAHGDSPAESSIRAGLIAEVLGACPSPEF